MEVILTSVKWQFALVYFEDVVLFSHSFSDHIKHLYLVLKLLQQAGVTLKLKKYFFLHNLSDYLGHPIIPVPLEVAPEAKASIGKLKQPTNVTDLRSVLELCNVFRRFVANFSRISAALNRNLRKVKPTKFDTLSQEELKALAELQNKFTTPPVL